MKQKYLITKNQEAHQITIQEFAELDKDIFSMVCEETYDSEKIKSAISEGKEELIEILRTPNLYPVAEYADKIADSVNELFNQSDQDAIEIAFDDIEALKKEKLPKEEESNEASVALDDLLNDDLDDDEGDEGDDSDDNDSDDDDKSLTPEIDEDAIDLFDEDSGDTDEDNDNTDEDNEES